jgi:UPF0271 protein
MKSKVKTLVLDASAFIMGFDPLSLDAKTYTTPNIIQELVGLSIHLRYTVAIETKKLKVISPSKNYVNIVKEASTLIGDKSKLSDADISVLALAIELLSQGFDPIIISDDYSIQNVAEYLGVKHASMSTLGIKARIQWLIYCPACHENFPPNFLGKICTVCGTQVRRKAFRKFPSHKKLKYENYVC